MDLSCMVKRSRDGTCARRRYTRAQLIIHCRMKNGKETQGDIADKIKRTRLVIESSLKELTKPGPNVRTGPIELCLTPYWNEIVDSYRNGWTTKAIAELFVQRGVEYKVGSVRIRIAKMRRSKHRYVPPPVTSAHRERHVIFQEPPAQPTEPTPPPSAIRVPPARQRKRYSISSKRS